MVPIVEDAINLVMGHRASFFVYIQLLESTPATEDTIFKFIGTCSCSQALASTCCKMKYAKLPEDSCGNSKLILSCEQQTMYAVTVAVIHASMTEWMGGTY